MKFYWLIFDGSGHSGHCSNTAHTGVTLRGVSSHYGPVLNNMVRLLGLIITSILIACTDSLQMSSIFSDGAVLQTTEEGGQPAVIFGVANASSTILVQGTAGFGKMSTTADDKGLWKVTVTEAPANPGPYNATITEYRGSTSQLLDTFNMSDIFFGDVYFCSGQSNMAFGMSGIFNATEELAHANHSNIRLFKAGLPRFQMKDRVTADPGWMLCNNATVASFSAVCYLSGRDIMNMHTGKRYIGLVESAVGGTGIQLWVSNATEMVCGQEAVRLKENYQPAVLFGSMVLPYLPYTVRAAFWYQGEANADECCPIGREDYSCYLEHLITDWQGVWGYKVPFVVIQLHVWGYMPCDEEEVLANELESGIRLAQWDVGRRNESNVALVSAVDLGGSLHPPYKSEVGRRVALATVGTVFHQPVQWQYPYIRNATGNWTNSKFEVDVYVENGEGLQMVDTPTCNQSDPQKCSVYCCKNGAPGMFILLGYNWSTFYTANPYNLQVVDIKGNYVHLSMLANDTYKGKPHVVRILYQLSPHPFCSLVNGQGLAMPTQGPIPI